jgi:signal transduction histidine kinase
VLEIFEHKKDKFPTDLVPMIGTLLKSNQDLLDLINKLLEIYQYEAGHAHLHVETFTILQILQVALDDIHPLASAKQIEVTQSVPKALKIRADYSQIKRVLVNLLGNAVENIPPGSIIHVSAREEKAGGVIRIQDNGPGIAEELLPGLFNRYFTMGQKNKKIGSGLGLSICKMIMDLHGATIAVSSSPTSGTCFTLTFPKPES